MNFFSAVKDSAEKDSFFKKLPAMIPAIPEPVAVRKLLPLLSSSLEFGGAPASAVSSLMLIGRCEIDSSVTPEDLTQR
jgi:SCY1-like protein 1